MSKSTAEEMLEWLNEWRDCYHGKIYEKECIPGKDICFPAYEAIRHLIESQAEVDEEFVHKWACIFAEWKYIPTFGAFKRKFIEMLKEANVRIIEKKREK